MHCTPEPELWAVHRLVAQNCGGSFHLSGSAWVIQLPLNLNGREVKTPEEVGALVQQLEERLLSQLEDEQHPEWHFTGNDQP